MINIFHTLFDEVISSNVCIGYVNYDDALRLFLPLANKFEAQRKIQNESFYARLKRDILKGCVMPPLTIALVSKDMSRINSDDISEFVNNNVRDGYIIDGLQRLNILDSIRAEVSFDKDRIIPVTVIVAPSVDRLIYRMITLNNGQKPMTARHQIEILTGSIFRKMNFINISVKSEKETEGKRHKNVLPLSYISKAYTAHITQSPTNDNKKIIEAKLDQILVSRILERGFTESKTEFLAIVELIDRLSQESDAYKWFKVENNIISFAAAAQDSYDVLSETSPADFVESIRKFEIAFEAFDPSKLNVGKLRRQLVCEYIRKYQILSQASDLKLLEHFSDLTSS